MLMLLNVTFLSASVGFFVFVFVSCRKISFTDKHLDLLAELMLE